MKDFCRYCGRIEKLKGEGITICTDCDDMLQSDIKEYTDNIISSLKRESESFSEEIKRFNNNNEQIGSYNYQMAIMGMQMSAVNYAINLLIYYGKHGGKI